MNKSILVVDTPKSCADCRFCDYIEPIKSSICTADPTNMFKMKVEGAIYSILVNERCPLRPLPSKMGELIRCKDCEHWQCDDVDSYCDELGIFGTDMNSYCSYAKKGNK